MTFGAGFGFPKARFPMGAGPTLDMDFAGTGTLPSLVTFSRASTGSYFDSAGVLQSATYNILPYSEQFDNAAWGKAGMTVTANAATAPNNTVTGDKLIPDAVTGLPYTFQTITVVSGANYAWSVYLKAAGYSWVFLDAFDGANHRTWFDLSTGTIGTVEAGNTATITDVGNGWYRCTIARSSGGVSTSYAVAIVSNNNALNITGNGVSGVFAWGAQLEQASAPGPYYATTTTANGAQRLDYSPSTLQCNGLLIEEQRTNSVRNNTMQGTAAGTPGTLPTNWIGDTTVAGVTRQIVGTGVEKGITYIDIRVSGTTSGALIFGIQTEGNTQTAALNAQRWTSSLYARVVAGSFANITRVSHIVRYNDAAGVLLTSGALDITPTTAALNTQRFANTVLSSNALTAFVGQVFQVEAGAGVAVDITLRIGLPQLELGAFATSVIPTTTAAATRAADVASVNTLSPWYNATEGTLYAEYSRFGAVNFQTCASLGEATSQNLITLGFGSGAPSNSNRFSVTVAGSTQSIIVLLTNPALNTIAKTVGAYAENNFAGTANGAVPGTATSGVVPSGITVLSLGCNSALNGNFLNGYIRRIAYYPTRQPNATLRAITT